MAAKNLLPIDNSRTLGAVALEIRDHIVAIQARAKELSDALSESTADDPSGAGLVTLLGSQLALADALAVQALVGSVNTDINNVANSFVQYKSRINRQS